MKTLFALIFALFCFTSIQCSYTPPWKDCIKVFGWKTMNVTLDKPPVAGQNSTATICMKNTMASPWTTQTVHLANNGAITPVPLMDVRLDDDVYIPRGESHCWNNLTFPVPEGVLQTWVVEITFENAFAMIGCADMTLTFPSSEKFLGF